MRLFGEKLLVQKRIAIIRSNGRMNKKINKGTDKAAKVYHVLNKAFK